MRSWLGAARTRKKVTGPAVRGICEHPARERGRDDGSYGRSSKQPSTRLRVSSVRLDDAVRQPTICVPLNTWAAAHRTHMDGLQTQKMKGNCPSGRARSPERNAAPPALAGRLNASQWRPIGVWGRELRIELMFAQRGRSGIDLRRWKGRPPQNSRGRGLANFSTLPPVALRCTAAFEHPTRKASLRLALDPLLKLLPNLLAQTCGKGHSRKRERFQPRIGAGKQVLIGRRRVAHVCLHFGSYPGRGERLRPQRVSPGTRH